MKGGKLVPVIQHQSTKLYGTIQNHVKKIAELLPFCPF